MQKRVAAELEKRLLSTMTPEEANRSPHVQAELEAAFASGGAEAGEKVLRKYRLVREEY